MVRESGVSIWRQPGLVSCGSSENVADRSLKLTRTHGIIWTTRTYPVLILSPGASMQRPRACNASPVRAARVHMREPRTLARVNMLNSGCSTEGPTMPSLSAICHACVRTERVGRAGAEVRG